MEETYTAAKCDLDVAESATVTDREVLERAIAKLVLLGNRVGVSPGEMIQLLDSGLTVGDLVAYLTGRSGRRS